MKIDTSYDEYTTRCPMLGHLVPFKYCRQVNHQKPCHRLLDCWHEIFNVKAFVESNYSEKDIASILSPPKHKLSQILELVEKAKKSRQRDTLE